MAGLDEERLATEGAPPLFRDGRPTGDFYSSVPDLAHDGYEAGKGVIEAGAGAVEDGLEEAWDRAKDIRLPDPVIRVPW